MDDWVIRFRVGAVVIASLAVTAVLVFLFGAWPSVMRGQYQINIRFVEAPGVTVDTPVRKSGVLVGRVSRVELADDGVWVSTRINDRYKLRRNELCRIGTGSLLGDAVLEFVPADQLTLLQRYDGNKNNRLDAEELKQSQEYLNDGDAVSDGKVSSNPLRVLVNLEGSIRSAFDSIDGAGREVEKLAATINRNVGGGDHPPQLIQKAEAAMIRFDRTMAALEKLVGDEKFSAKLGQALDELPAFLAESRQTMTTAREALAKIQRAAEKAEVNLDNVAAVTGPLRERGPQLVQNIELSAKNLSNLLEQLSAFSESLNSGQGTLGRLIHDDEVYQQIQRTVANAEEVSRRLRPIVEDVRTFTDKIARDPSQLGVKGALDRRPTGLKTGFNLTPEYR